MKARIAVLAVFFSLMLILVACGKGEEQKDQPSVSSVTVNSSETTKGSQVSPEISKNAKNNADAFLEYAKRVKKEVDFMGSGDYASFMVGLGNVYKKDIANPYTGKTNIGISNRTTSYFKIKDSEIYKVDSIEFIAIDDFMTDLSEINTSEVVYCLNPLNKGCTIAFLLKDGIYIYEVDENGNKKNEIKHYFKDDQ